MVVCPQGFHGDLPASVRVSSVYEVGRELVQTFRSMDHAILQQQTVEAQATLAISLPRL